ncbi:5-methyltetrahydropteroyltriglutamate--homocysteine S-methyltransferase [Fructobacillus americanaquae]|uniref:5-methyltetrahydropteroyltriglutamate--homocysteine S-methyltransferase n=1 Tax=Fructobacillus americanaquae TaxID=2940302 RepID=A0ABY5BYJ6_9LACO|nr:5-methyltetrahydropteroyltriglutamate--homocysteine S-methyltransferase [Fructobacillus americanaquae]USS91580.1 5-methyltetrahydropteroyltriglutamate--homocysteine S-methyltransferase [Fructobacillus americanaquae]
MAETAVATLTKAPVHFDIVGSFLRPERLKQAQRDLNDGKISQADLTKIQDEEIKDLVEKEVKAGLHYVSDGEFRRHWWHLDTFWGFEGIKKTNVDHGYLFHDVETRAESAQVDGKIRFTDDHPDLKAFLYLKEITKDLDVIPRQSIPSPAQAYAELVRGEENIAILKKFYPKHEDLVHDLTTAYHDLYLALYAAGCRDIKLDDCTWGMLADTDFWAEQNIDQKGVDELQAEYLKINNQSLENLPEDLRISTHVCRGNYASTWAAKGGYATVANTLFTKENVESFYLEFDDDRSGDFAPLAKVPAGKQVVLGLVTSKKPELEDPQVLIDRVREASQFVPLENLALSTQCGFASTEEGNHLTEDEQWAKIKLVVDTAEKIWG